MDHPFDFYYYCLFFLIITGLNFECGSIYTNFECEYQNMENTNVTNVCIVNLFVCFRTYLLHAHAVFIEFSASFKFSSTCYMQCRSFVCIFYFEI